jgi:hypothetical protein
MTGVCRSAALDCEDVPEYPSRTRLAHGFSGLVGVGDQMAEDCVGDAPLQTSQRLHRCLRLGELAAVVGAAFGVVTDLHDRGNVQQVIHPPAPRPRQPVVDVLAT